MAEVLFKDVAKDWWERFMLSGAEHYAHESWRRLEREVMPRLGEKPIKKITAPMILTILRRIEKRGTFVVARKIKSHISQVMRYGIACGYIYTNPARDLGFALTPYKHRPRAAIVEPRQIGMLIRDIQAFKPKLRRCALQLAAYTLLRPGELCQIEWAEVDMNTAEIRLAADKMKMKRPHAVPLPTQALEILRELHALTGAYRWLFPSRWDKSRHMQGGVLNTALDKIGYSGEVMTAHGFRAMGATILSDQGWPSEAIERQLAHVDRNQVRAAYQRSELLVERRKMMQAWADYLDMRCAWAILGR